MKVNKSNDAEFYVIRKNYLNFLNKVDKSLDGQELKSCMQEEIKINISGHYYLNLAK